MNFGFQQEPERTDELGRDMLLAEQLAALDPATEDPNYWFRFHAGVMSNAARSLAQRRLIAELTIADVVASWGRTIVPTAALAAALAGIILLRSGVAGPVPDAPVTPVGAEVEAADELLLPPSAAAGMVVMRVEGL